MKWCLPGWKRASLLGQLMPILGQWRLTECRTTFLFMVAVFCKGVVDRRVS